jgi:hypothetical protein
MQVKPFLNQSLTAPRAALLDDLRSFFPKIAGFQSLWIRRSQDAFARLTP